MIGTWLQKNYDIKNIKQDQDLLKFIGHGHVSLSFNAPYQFQIWDIYYSSHKELIQYIIYSLGVQLGITGNEYVTIYQIIRANLHTAF